MAITRTPQNRNGMEVIFCVDEESGKAWTEYVNPEDEKRRTIATLKAKIRITKAVIKWSKSKQDLKAAKENLPKLEALLAEQ